MDHQRIGHRAARSVTEVLADARDLQSRHAPGLLGAAASWIRGRFAPRAGERAELAARHLVVH